jgi:hypothetical protein
MDALGSACLWPCCARVQVRRAWHFILPQVWDLWTSMSGILNGLKGSGTLLEASWTELPNRCSINFRISGINSQRHTFSPVNLKTSGETYI